MRFFSRVFKRIKRFVKKLLNSTEVSKVVEFVDLVKSVVESSKSELVTTLTPTDKDDKLLKRLKDGFTKVETFKELTKNAKDKEDTGELILFFINKVKQTKKTQRGYIYLAIGSELLRRIDKGLSTSQANTIVQLQVQQNKEA